MYGQYPRFKNSYFYEELTENFLLTPAELEFVRNCRGDANRQGMAILLKGLQYLGYFPESLQQVPGSIRSFMGKQLGLLTDFINEYPWETSTRERHLAQIREFTGWRSMTSQDKEELEQFGDASWFRRTRPSGHFTKPCRWSWVGQIAICTSLSFTERSMVSLTRAAFGLIALDKKVGHGLRGN